MSTLLEIKKSPVLRLKFAGDADTGEFEGYGSVFGNHDAHGDVVVFGAFTDTLAEHRAAKTMPLMLWMHEEDKPIGRWLDLKQDEIGLKVRGRLNLKTGAGADAFHHITEGDVSGLSIGYLIRPDGSQRKGGTRFLISIELVEISVVTFPANGAARIKLDSKGDLETLLTKAGLAREAAKRVAFGGWPALTGKAQGTSHTKAAELADMIARATAQLKV